jgi:hypothetical protein
MSRPFLPGDVGLALSLSRAAGAGKMMCGLDGNVRLAVQARVR